jgi:F0F1-type ATP synthase delta subunit
MQELQEILNHLEPAEALAALAPELKKILAHLDEEARADFVIAALGGAEGDKIGSLVDL